MLHEDYYDYHFDLDKLMDFMYIRNYDNVVVESKAMPRHYFVVQIEYVNEHGDYIIEWVERVLMPNQFDWAYINEYREYVRNYKKPRPVTQTKYEDDTWILEKVEHNGHNNSN